MGDMANSALYVRLDKETYERLRALSAEQRRQMGDQAAMLLREVLEAQQAQQTVAA
jgi:predicted DNA-binding protein